MSPTTIPLKQRDGDSGVIRLTFTNAHSTRLSYADVLELWQTDPDFQDLFGRELSTVPFTAFRWETPPVTQSTIKREFECVVIDWPTLERPKDPTSFADQFRRDPTSQVIAFPNLSGDSLLIVPRPIDSSSEYTHLARFLRSAPREQQRAMWKLVGKTMTQRIGSHPTWLSTAGDGIAWLHVRLDSRPKYYSHTEYRSVPTEDRR